MEFPETGTRHLVDSLAKVARQNSRASDDALTRTWMSRLGSLFTHMSVGVTIAWSKISSSTCFESMYRSTLRVEGLHCTTPDALVGCITPVAITASAVQLQEPCLCLIVARTCWLTGCFELTSRLVIATWRMCMVDLVVRSHSRTMNGARPTSSTCGVVIVRYLVRTSRDALAYPCWPGFSVNLPRRGSCC